MQVCLYLCLLGGGGVKGRQHFSLPISSVFVGGGVKGRQRFSLPISSVFVGGGGC